MSTTNETTPTTDKSPRYRRSSRVDGRGKLRVSVVLLRANPYSGGEVASSGVSRRDN